MSARASLPATLIAVLLFVLTACSTPAATPSAEPDETEATQTEAPETEEPEDGEESILALGRGDCFNVVDEEDQTAEAVDCDEEHEYEVYAVVAIDEDGLPDDEELEELAGECFGDEFTDFVGIEYAQSRWYTTPFLPTEDDWDDGHEVIVCALYDPDEEETEGSAEGSEAGQAEETEEPEEPTTARGCFTEQITIPEEENYHSEDEGFAADDYGTNPPTGGIHSMGSLSGGEYYVDPPLGEAVHSLDHGMVIIWIDDRYDLVGEAVNELWAGPYSNAVVLVEYTDMDVPLAATSWDRLMTCESVNEEAIEEMISFVEVFHAKSPEAEAVCLSAELFGESLPNCR